MTDRDGGGSRRDREGMGVGGGNGELPTDSSRATGSDGAGGGCALSAGQEITGRFRVVSFLASGGMGEVYEAEDLVLSTRVALKILRPALASDQLAIERLKREIQLARQVTHRSVCRIFDVFQDRLVDAEGVEKNVLGLSMELLEGETLSQRIARQGPMSPEEALPLIGQMAAALDAAHAAGVIHRDLKCGNVMLVPAPADPGGVRVVVTDFGLARLHSAAGRQMPGITGEHRIVGSADYMAPEQAQGLESTPASDVYAFGVMLFEMVTGCRPHTGDTPMAVLIKRIKDEPPSARSLVPGLRPNWDRVITRCLATDPRVRYQSAGAVLAALTPAPAETSAGSAVAAARGRSGRRWLIAFAVVTGLAVMLSVTLLIWRPGEPPTPMFPGPQQATSWPGLEVDPSFSPDGTRLAFSANKTGTFEIYVSQLMPGSREVQLSADGSQSFQPEWSPDGSRIAFYSARRGGIWVLPAMGGEARRLTESGSHPAWSPDGSLILFQTDETAELSANAGSALPPSVLMVVPGGGGSPHELTSAGEPPGGHGGAAWSHDGSRIYFTASDRRLSRVWSVAADGSDLIAITGDDFVAFDPTVSPDGSYLYFSTVTEGERYGVWRVALDRRSGAARGDPVRVVTSGAASIRGFAISRDGRRMVHTALSTVSNLWGLPLSSGTGEAAGELRPLTQGTGRNNRPAFSPDGSLIAFDRWQIGSSRDVWVIGADGSEPRRLTLDPNMDTEPTWLPDGAGVVFVSDRWGPWTLLSVDLESGAERTLATLDPEVDGVRISPDGQRIAYHSVDANGAINIWVAMLDGSNARQITFDEELMGFPSWSPEGTRLAFEMRRGVDDHLMVMAASGGEIRQLTTTAGQTWPYGWSPDGDKIACARFLAGRWELWWISSSSGEQRQLTFLERPNVYVRYPTWSPRGDQIVFELAETTGDLWLVEPLP